MQTNLGEIGISLTVARHKVLKQLSATEMNWLRSCKCPVKKRAILWMKQLQENTMKLLNSSFICHHSEAIPKFPTQARLLLTEASSCYKS